MNTLTKRFTAILTSAVLLTGCSSTASSTAASSSSKLRVGMECNYAPFNWTTTESGEYTQKISGVDYCDGYDVAVAKKLADATGRELEVVKLDWDNLILSLNQNNIDAIIAGMTATEDRMKQVNFTSPYYESEEVMIVQKDSDYANATSIHDFKGATVQGQLNTIYDEVIDQIDDVNHLPGAESFPAAIQALQAGTVDGVVSELPVANGAVAANPSLTIVRFAEGEEFEADTTVSIAVRKSDETLLNELEEALSAINTDTRNEMMEEAVNRQPATN